MIKAIIVDDESLARDTLRKQLENNCSEVTIVAECSNAQTARENIEKLQPQLIFLDIAMPGSSGIDLLKEIKELNAEVIFVTAHDEYTPQAIRLSAVDYLLKPVDDQELKQAVQRATKKIEARISGEGISTFLYNIQHKLPRQDMQLSIPTSKGFQIIRINTIACCEAENTYTIIHLLNNHQLVSTKPLLEYENMLEDVFFVRIHKSWIINMMHLKEYRRGEGGIAIMTNNKEIEVSRRRKDYFLSYMKQYFKS